MQAVISYDDQQARASSRDVTITYVGNDRKFAQTYFNANAFPKETHRTVNSAASRFAMFHYQLKLLRAHLTQDRKRFVEHILEPKMDLEGLLKRQTPDRFVAKFDGLETLTCLHGLFYVLKSFLDVYAQLLCRLTPAQQFMTFGRARMGEKHVAGGTFINWLRNSAPASFVNAEKLADVIEIESLRWITEAVAHRDTLGHFSDIDDIHALQVPLRKLSKSGDPMFHEGEISAPRMPNQTDVEQYVSELGVRLRELVRSTLVLFPNVKQNLIAYPDFDIDQPLWPVA